MNSPTLTADRKEEYISFVDKIVHAYISEKSKYPQLYNKLRQGHRHSKTCRKYKDQICRFNVGKSVTSPTNVAEPLPENMPEKEKILLLQKQSDILKKVKYYINNYVNPFKVNFFELSRDNFRQENFVSEVFTENTIDKKEYENALKMSDFKLHLGRLTNSSFVNDYFGIQLLAWEANTDTHPVLYV